MKKELEKEYVSVPRSLLFVYKVDIFSPRNDHTKDHTNS
jgi:hypothetical protein